ncbi:hypothetical protein J2Z21_002826 [Streptomyces griseochromogenes]|uniref:Uncharacterized protein n=1 Tax=Streptomyces griseochromogenes TaxID=68214 RepID=A0ABS4LR54_9ACTN|nr:hypothetical protein [Streptomyces griseochromogenes]
MGPVHGTVVQLQKFRLAQLCQQGGVQAGPDASLGPVPQSAPRRHPRAAHGLGGNVAPCDTGPQHVQHARECRAVCNTQATRIAAAPFRNRRQQRSRTLPQVIRNKVRTHPDTLPNKITKRKTTGLNSF